MLNQRSWLCVSRVVCAAVMFSLSGTLWAQQRDPVTGEELPAGTSAPANQSAPIEQPAPAEQPAPVDEPVSVDEPVPADQVPPATPAAKTVYRSVDANGKVTFTDIPPQGRPSEEVKVHAANTMPIGVPAASEENGSASEQDEHRFVKYTLLAITSPANDEVFGQDVESVTLAAQLEPGLQDGHTFQLYFDGKPVGTNEMSYTVTPLERGTHTVEAKVFDGKKKLLKSARKVQFHVRRISALNKVTAAALRAGDNQPGAPGAGFVAPKGAGGVGGGASASGANSPGDANSSRGAASGTKSK